MFDQCKKPEQKNLMQVYLKGTLSPAPSPPPRKPLREVKQHSNTPSPVIGRPEDQSTTLFNLLTPSPTKRAALHTPEWAEAVVVVILWGHWRVEVNYSKYQPGSLLKEKLKFYNTQVEFKLWLWGYLFICYL